MQRLNLTRIITSLTLILSLQGSLAATYPVEPPRAGITTEFWNKLYPYLLPEDSEIMDTLNDIFGKSRVTLNKESMEKAGFSTGKAQEWSRIVVTKHPALPGYVFKIYLDDQDAKPDPRAQFFFEKRARGARLIQSYIDKHNLSHLFKVPKKWVYMLPETKLPKKKYSFKNFILVEEDMQILSKDENKLAWKSSQVTEDTLVALFHLLKDLGLLDCSKIDNIPFSIDGKIAFIDTETSGMDWVPYKRLKKSLSPKMKRVWVDLTRHEKQ